MSLPVEVSTLARGGIFCNNFNELPLVFNLGSRNGVTKCVLVCFPGFIGVGEVVGVG